MKTTLAAICVSLTLALPAHASLIAGGGFDSNADLANWTVGNDGGGANPVITIGPAFGLGPQAGAGYLGFTGNNVNEDGFVEQTVNVTPGQLYELIFYWGGRGSGGAQVTVTSTDTAPILDQEFTANVVGPWTQETFLITATDTSLTIRFQETSNNSQSKGPGIDSVSLNAIPEPSTYLVFGGLMLCFGAAGWWRKRRQAA